MNREEAKNILLLYRTETADADDPQIAEALALAKNDPELALWLEEHSARQNALRIKFRQITVPTGLKEQIVSERAAHEKFAFWKQKALLTAAAVVTTLILLTPFWFHSHPDDTFAIYRSRMVSTALRGYAMDLATDNPAQIRAYLMQNHAPANFILPASLKQIPLTGCAVERWQDTPVSMICFHTAKTTTGAANDLWLFVIDRASVKDSPSESSPQFARVNRLVTATWTLDGQLYLLGTEGDEQTLRKFL